MFHSGLHSSYRSASGSYQSAHWSWAEEDMVSDRSTFHHSRNGCYLLIIPSCSKAKWLSSNQSNASLLGQSQERLQSRCCKAVGLGAYSPCNYRALGRFVCWGIETSTRRMLCFVSYPKRHDTSDICELTHASSVVCCKSQLPIKDLDCRRLSGL